MTEKRIIRISPSGLNGIQTCFRAAYFHRVLGYNSPEEAGYEPFVKGTLVHSILELYYNNVIASKSPLDNIKECLSKTKELLASTSLDEETKNHLTTTLMEYFGYYQSDLYKPVSVESPFSYELYEDESVRILLEGKIDLITERDQDGTKISYVFDHKSRSRDATPTLLQNQYMAYALATGICNVVDNQVGLQTTLKPKDKFKRRILSYTPDQLEEFAEFAVFWVLQFDTAVQQNHFPPNYTSCFQCDFRSVCESGKEFRQEKLERFFVKRKDDYDIFG